MEFTNTNQTNGYCKCKQVRTDKKTPKPEKKYLKKENNCLPWKTFLICDFFSFQEEKLVVSGIRHFLDATLFLYREQRPDFQLRLKWGVPFVHISKPSSSHYFFLMTGPLLPAFALCFMFPAVSLLQITGGFCFHLTVPSCPVSPVSVSGWAVFWAVASFPSPYSR